MLNNLCFAPRQFCKSLGFSSTAVITLALGIGAHVAIFTFINAVLRNSLLYDLL